MADKPVAYVGSAMAIKAIKDYGENITGSVPVFKFELVAIKNFELFGLKLDEVAPVNSQEKLTALRQVDNLIPIGQEGVAPEDVQLMVNAVIDANKSFIKPLPPPGPRHKGPKHTPIWKDSIFCDPKDLV